LFPLGHIVYNKDGFSSSKYLKFGQKEYQ